MESYEEVKSKLRGRYKRGLLTTKQYFDLVTEARIRFYKPMKKTAEKLDSDETESALEEFLLYLTNGELL